MFKKIYVEITNNCNLSCSFCNEVKRKREFITIDRFKILMNKLKGYTNYLYFHLMGEPLLHPNINELIDIASNYFNINITTNGYLLDRIKDKKNITQINISLHSYNEKYNKTLDKYLNNIFDSCESLLNNNTIINYRLWTNTKYKDEILNKLNNYYNVNINGNTKIRDNVFIEFDTKFIWPDLDNNYCNDNGSCMGLRTHIGILVDGTVVPCCLDTNGIINLGNIYKDDLNVILNQTRVKNMMKNFMNNKKVENLCKHCNFYDRIIKQFGSDSYGK